MINNIKKGWFVYPNLVRFKSPFSCFGMKLDYTWKVKKIKKRQYFTRSNDLQNETFRFVFNVKVIPIFSFIMRLNLRVIISYSNQWIWFLASRSIMKWHTQWKSWPFNSERLRFQTELDCICNWKELFIRGAQLNFTSESCFMSIFGQKKSLTGYSWHTASAHWTWRRTTFSALPYPLRLPDDISDRGRTWLEHRSPFVHWGEPLSQGLFICSLVPILSPEMDRALDGGPLWGSFLAGLRQNIIAVMSN